MRTRMTAFLFAPMFFAALGVSQDNSTAGAKQLFFLDVTTGNKLPGNTVPKPTIPRPPAPRPMAQKPPEVTGLMYYIEVVQPNGQALRVSTNRQFHNGERIRFHVLSNTGGRLTMLQSENGGAFMPLFPHPQLRGGDDRVEREQDTVIPMRFDNKPGNLRLMVMLAADGTPQAAAREAMASNGGKPSPAQLPDPPLQQGTSQGSLGGLTPEQKKKLEADAGKVRVPFSEREVRAQLDRQTARPKSLVVEMDEDQAKPAKFVVVDSRRDSGATPGMVAVEVKLDHQP